MNDVKNNQTDDHIRVSFSVNIDLTTLSELKIALDNTVQGTVECSVAWDNINNYYKYLMKRLDGECLAYMNIAKEKTKLQFGM